MTKTDKHVSYRDARSALQDFMSVYGEDDIKLAEDPSRDATTPEDMKEGKPQTTETSVGDGVNAQKGLGAEMTDEIRGMAPAGHSVNGTVTSSGDSTNGIVAPAQYTESECPCQDISKMDNVDPSIKKAYAHYFRLGNEVVNMIDSAFEEQAAKNASDAQLNDVVSRAYEMKMQHMAFLQDQFGMSPKQASDTLDALADQDPSAILPPEAMTDADAEATLADAANADAAAAEGAPEGEGSAEEQVADFVDAMRGEGFSDDEIADALEQAANEQAGAEDTGSGDPEAEVADFVEAMRGEGFSDDEIADALEQAASEQMAGEKTASDAPADGAVDEETMAQVQSQLEDAVDQLTQEGYSQEEIAQALMDEMGISPDEVVDTVVNDLMDKGFTEDEAKELLANLGELEAQGVTPEQFAEALSQAE